MTIKRCLPFIIFLITILLGCNKEKKYELRSISDGDRNLKVERVVGDFRRLELLTPIMIKACGKIPRSEDGFSAFFFKPKDFECSGYYEKIEMKVTEDEISTDPWGTKYKYLYQNKAIDLISAGPDKKFGTKDDYSYLEYVNEVLSED